MASGAYWYGNALKNAFKKLINFEEINKIKVLLCTSTYTPNQDTHEFLNQVVANEVSGTGYTAGGKAVSNCALSYDASTNMVKFDGDDVSWPNAVITARFAIVYYDSGSPETSPVLAYYDFGEDEVSTGGEFKLQWNVDGMLKSIAT